jgi:hypothetical protein
MVVNEHADKKQFYYVVLDQIDPPATAAIFSCSIRYQSDYMVK